MGLFIVVIGGFIIYFFFIKKGESGTTILNHRKEIHKYVQQHGGMVKLYQEIVDYFIGEDFEIREVTKDYIYLHYGTSKGKVGVEILQVEVKKAQVTVGVETAHGAVSKQEIEVHSEADSKEALQHIKESLNLLDSSTKEKMNSQVDNATVVDIETSPKSRRSFADEFNKRMKANREKFEVEISEQKGDELYRSGEYVVAAYVYLALYNENLHVPEYIIKCINSHVRMGELTEAKAYLTLAEMHHDTDYRLPFLKASINLNEGKLKEAFDNISTARTMCNGRVKEVNDMYEMCKAELDKNPK